MLCMMYDIIVFENLRFRQITRKRYAGNLKKVPSDDHFRKLAFLVFLNAVCLWT